MAAWSDGVAAATVAPPRVSWGDEPVFAPPPEPEPGWIGRKELVAPRMGCAATFMAPTVVSGVVVVVPPGKNPGHGFPYEFDFTFPENVASMVAQAGMRVDSIGGMPVDVTVDSVMDATATMFAPSIEADAPEISVPVMEASALMRPPIMGADLVVFAPNMGGDMGFPYVFDMVFGAGQTTAALLPPSVNYVVPAPVFGGATQMFSPQIVVDATVDASSMISGAEIVSPTVSTGYVVQPPRFTAHAALQAPTAADGDLVPAPPMGANASMLAPTVGVYAIVTVNAPTMGGGDGFPYEFDFEFVDPVYPTRATMLAPSIDYAVTAPRMASTASFGAGHSVGLGAIIGPPRMTSAALFRAPSVVSSVQVSAPRMTSAALLRTPQPWISDVFVTVTTNQRVAVPRWARFIGYVLLGGGAGGANGSIFSTGNGGKPGTYLDGVWDRNSTPEIGSVNCSIGNGGGSGNGAGGNTTIWGDAYDEVTYSGYTATANGGSGTNSGRDAQGPGNRTAQGISAVGGTGNGDEPGSGGRGGAWGFSGNSGASGAKGRIWLRFWM